MMSPGVLFLFGMIVFALLLVGLALTMIEFHRMTKRPDLVVGSDLQETDRETTAVEDATA